jgi:dTDP-4-amino-4,6-dideoxygalactose transaminase
MDSLIMNNTIFVRRSLPPTQIAAGAGITLAAVNVTFIQIDRCIFDDNHIYAAVTTRYSIGGGIAILVPSLFGATADLKSLMPVINGVSNNIIISSCIFT